MSPIIEPAQDTSVQYQESLSDADRIRLIRERRKELDAIRRGDFFVIRNNPDEALAHYLPVSERLPDDILLQKKIGHAYYLQKDWKNAYKYYSQVPLAELDSVYQNELFASLFFDEMQRDRMGELMRFPLSQEESEFYSIVDACHSGVHNCIEKVMAYSGVSLDIVSLRSALLDAEKVSPDISYRHFVLASRLYDIGVFRASFLIARDILAVKPDYASVQKLIGFSLYEIGNYHDAKKYLLMYLERYPDDLQTIVRLGDIAFAQSDFVGANLYYNNAIFSGQIPKTDIERKLAYSYAQLGDIPAMLKVLAYLLDEEDATHEDAATAISLALQNGENLKAYVWANSALKKYNDNPNIVSLYLTTLRMIGKPQDALLYIDTLPPYLSDLPLILLEKAILLHESGANQSALPLFRQVTSIDRGADFGIEAQNYIDYILVQTQSDTELVREDSIFPWWR